MPSIHTTKHDEGPCPNLEGAHPVQGFEKPG